MERLEGWTVGFLPGRKDGYCWFDIQEIHVGLDNDNPLRLLLHEIAHIGINPHGNKHTQEWFDEFLSLMRRYMLGIDISDSDKVIQKTYNLKGDLIHEDE